MNDYYLLKRVAAHCRIGRFGVAEPTIVAEREGERKNKRAETILKAKICAIRDKCESEGVNSKVKRKEHRLVTIVKVLSYGPYSRLSLY